jgi:hypothetical protein
MNIYISSQLLRYVGCLISSFALVSCSFFESEQEQPGNRPNPKLATLLQQSFNSEIASMNPTWSPGLRTGANLSATAWLTKIAEVKSTCSYGPDNFTKHNKLRYEIKLTSGEVIFDIYSGLLCQYQNKFGKPLVMQVKLKDGVVVEALTDGRELEEPVGYAKGWLSNLAEKILYVDRKRRPQLYYRNEPTRDQIRKEWAK